MRKLKTTDITTSVAMPIKSGTLDHLQFANQEVFSAICQSMVGMAGYDNTKVYILSGLENSGSGSNYILTAGAIFYNGEVYLVDAATFTITGANVAEATLSVTPFTAANADPVSFSDGNSYYVHDIRKALMGEALSGSGMGDYVDFIRIDLVQGDEVLRKGNTTPFTPTLNYEPATKAYVDAAALLKVKAYGTYVVNNPPYPAGFTKTISIGSTLANTNYIVLGTLISLGAPGYDAGVQWALVSKTTTSFDVFFGDIYSLSQNVNFDWILFQA